MKGQFSIADLKTITLKNSIVRFLNIVVNLVNQHRLRRDPDSDHALIGQEQGLGAETTEHYTKAGMFNLDAL